MILFPEGRPRKPQTFEKYCASGGYQVGPEKFSPQTILKEVTESGLRGRGGAGFPVGKKWEIARTTPTTPRYVVCNAGEDEPGSFKDRVLLEYRPHLVLEGTILAARAIEAESAYFYINETYTDCITRVKEAIREATAAGYLRSLNLSIHRSPTVYVAGEDSAAVEDFEGKTAKTRQKPPFPATTGIYGT